MTRVLIALVVSTATLACGGKADKKDKEPKPKPLELALTAEFLPDGPACTHDKSAVRVRFTVRNAVLRNLGKRKKSGQQELKMMAKLRVVWRITDKSGEVVGLLKKTVTEPVNDAGEVVVNTRACPNLVKVGEYKLLLRIADRHGEGTARKSVMIKKIAAKSFARLVPLAAGYTRLPATKLQIKMPADAKRVKGPDASRGDFIALGKLGRLNINEQATETTLELAVKAIKKKDAFEFKGMILKQGTGRLYTLIYRIRYRRGPRRKRNRVIFGQVIKRNLTYYVCFAIAKNEKDARAFHALCNAIK